MIRKVSSRRLVLGCAVALMLLLAGDYSAQTQTVSLAVGIDPLAVLDLTVSPNVAFIVDTSSSMWAPFNSSDGNSPVIGGDDYSSKMYQAKKVVKAVIAANTGKVNFGLLSYYARNADKKVSYFVQYVTDQPSAAYWTGGNGTSGIDTTSDFFGRYDMWDTPGTNTGTGGSYVYASFMAPPFVVDTGPQGNACKTTGDCKWYLASGFVRSGVRYKWSSKSSVVASAVDCSADENRAPLRLFPDDPHEDVATKTDYARPCVQMQYGSGAVTTFWYTSVGWPLNPDVNQCNGAALIEEVPHCQSNDPGKVFDQLNLEMPVDGSCTHSGTATPEGIPCGTTPTGTGTATKILGTNPADDPNTMEGLTAGGYTPLYKSLLYVYNEHLKVFAHQVEDQPNFVILVTDGLDMCGGAAYAAPQAKKLYDDLGITTFVVAMGISASKVDDIALAGSGNKYKAFSAQSPEELTNVLIKVINQTSVVGEYSDQQTITESVYEFAKRAGNDPMDPKTRYASIIPLLLQSTFEMPGFLGHLKAFANKIDPDTKKEVAEQLWDAGDKLCLQVTGYGATQPEDEVSRCDATGSDPSAMGNLSYTFDVITGTADPLAYYEPNGRLKRRIFTTARNGVFPYGSAEQQLVPLWPPTTTRDPLGVDPVYDKNVKAPDTPYLNGSLDAPLGIASMDLATLKATFNACVDTTGGGVLPAHCLTTADVGLQEGKARKEARQIILAHTAGAVVNGRDSKTGELLYTAKSWILGDATLSAAALITVPILRAPTLYSAEYNLLLKGTQSTDDMSLGLGLREPDRTKDSSLKPVMSVVYYGANDMLHAFRAGPDGATPPGESGGEELWGFVPYDQLGKLQLLLLEGQSRAAHKYMIATGLRYGDVFVPKSYEDPKGVTRAGKWRRLLFFGRGIAGKYYTALDVTSPGSFTTPALKTQPPLPVWSRGNPDTVDGTATGSANYLTNDQVKSDVDLGATDSTAYATMGQTWSVPALTRVPIEDGATPANPLNNGLDFMLYVGSGYGAVSGEGRYFYSIDPLTGDILTSTDVGEGATTGTTNFVENAILASPAVFNPKQLLLDVGHPASSTGTQVYVGDLHGRLWRFFTDNADDAKTITAGKLWDFGVQRPIANPVALLNYRTAENDALKPHIYVATGNDRRVSAPTDGFVLAGLRDDGTDTDGNPLATLLFALGLNDTEGGGPFRGTVQPATTLMPPEPSKEPLARVIFAATRYNPLGEDCVSTFDSRVYIVGAASGKAAFDLDQSGNVDLTGDTDLYYDMEGKLVKAVQVAFGQLVVDQGLSADKPPPPPAPPQIGESASSSQVFLTSFNPAGSSVCR